MAISCIDASNVWKIFFEDKELYYISVVFKLQLPILYILHTSTRKPRQHLAVYTLRIVSMFPNGRRLGAAFRHRFPD